MNRGRSYRRGSGVLSLVLILFFSLGALMGLKLETDCIHREKIPGSSVIYIPSGKYLKVMTFGFSSVVADLIYLWTIQYYSDNSIADRFNYLEHILSVISELDPRYVDPYEVCALIAAAEAKNVDLALKILDLGLEKNPEQWIFPFEAGHIAQTAKKDYQLAQAYYKKAMAIKGAPDILPRLYANAAYKIMDYKTSWETWLEIYQTTTDERIKKIASNHLYQVKATVDIGALKDAITNFKEKLGRNPENLDQLVAAGYLSSKPQDFDGQDYVYDPETGEVKPAIIPWKR